MYNQMSHQTNSSAGGSPGDFYGRGPQTGKTGHQKKENQNPFYSLYVISSNTRKFSPKKNHQSFLTIIFMLFIALLCM
jgi:hypothetical protein